VRVIVLTANFNGEGLSEQAVKFLCIHELGHALGIEGHSLSPKDIMFSMLPYNFENLKLSARDGKTLRKLYSTAIVAPPDEHPDSGAIKRNLAAALNNTGLTALDAQQYDKALDLFQQAQSLNPESKTVRSNIANAHLDCGMSFLRGENFAEAENSLKLAVEEFEAIGNKAMLTRAANNYAIVLKQLGKGDEGKAIKEKYSVAGI
jgi:tetratricopeptide (TPR) repeat protein